MGRGRAPRVRVRRRHRHGLRVLRRGGARTGRRGGRGPTCGDPEGGEPRRRARSNECGAFCLELPEAEERPFGGHTRSAFRVRDKLFVMTSEDATSMTMKAPKGAQADSGGVRARSGSSCPKYVGPIGWVGVQLDHPRHSPTGRRWPSSSPRATASRPPSVWRQQVAGGLGVPPLSARVSGRVSVAVHALGVADATLGHAHRLPLAHDQPAAGDDPEVGRVGPLLGHR